MKAVIEEICIFVIQQLIRVAEEIPAIESNRGEDEDECPIDMVSFSWSFGSSYVTFIMGFFAILWINSYWRRMWIYYNHVFVEKIAYQYAILRAHFEWVLLSESEKSCEVWVLLREYFESVYLFIENGAWVNEKLFLKVHPRS